MRRELNDLLFVDAIQYTNSMKENKCLPEGVQIVDFKIGKLPTINTPTGTALLKDGDYILKVINNDNYVCDSHYFHNIKIHKELKDLITKKPERVYKENIQQDILNHKFTELASVYILNNEPIKVRPGYNDTIIDGILNNKGVYIQINNLHHKTLHIFDNEHRIAEIESYLKFYKEQYHRDFEQSVIIYPQK